MEHLQPLLDLLTARHGWLPAALGWMSALRLACKPISIWLQGALTELFAFVQATNESEDDEFVDAMLRARWYRVLAFLLDLLASVKLPTALPNPNPHEKI